jgi:2-phospho-L-lactate/phosphoenolpyruvate guanylyltransferase
LNRSAFAVIPMKSPRRSKQRLRASLPVDVCDKLALAMFERSVRIVREGLPFLALLVVTPADEIAAIAEAMGCFLLKEPSEDGLNAAANKAASWGIAHKFRSQLLIHADIPELSRDDVAAMLNAGLNSEGSVALCRSRSGGTSMLMTTGPDVLPFCFGPDSFQRHVRAAKERNLTITELHLPRAQLDVDTVSDLVDLAQTGSSKHRRSHRDDRTEYVIRPSLFKDQPVT